MQTPHASESKTPARAAVHNLAFACFVLIALAWTNPPSSSFHSYIRLYAELSSGRRLAGMVAQLSAWAHASSGLAFEHKVGQLARSTALPSRKLLAISSGPSISAGDPSLQLDPLRCSTTAWCTYARQQLAADSDA